MQKIMHMVRSFARTTKGCTQRLPLRRTASGTALVMKGWLYLLVGQAFEHQTHHAKIDPGLAGSRQKFVVFAHAAISANPGDRPLNNPAAWKQLEACRPQWWPLVDTQPLSASARSLDDL